MKLTAVVSAFRPQLMFCSECYEVRVVSTVSRLGRSLQKEGLVSSNIGDMPRRVYTDVGGSNNAPALFAGHVWEQYAIPDA